MDIKARTGVRVLRIENKNFMGPHLHRFCFYFFKLELNGEHCTYIVSM